RARRNAHVLEHRAPRAPLGLVELVGVIAAALVAGRATTRVAATLRHALVALRRHPRVVALDVGVVGRHALVMGGDAVDALAPGGLRPRQFVADEVPSPAAAAVTRLKLAQARLHARVVLLPAAVAVGGLCDAPVDLVRGRATGPRLEAGHGTGLA